MAGTLAAISALQLGLGIFGAVKGSKSPKQSNDPRLQPDWWTGPEARSNMVNYVRDLGATLGTRQAEIKGLYDPGEQYWNELEQSLMTPYARQMQEGSMQALSMLHKSYGANLANSPSAWLKFKNMQDEMSQKYGDTSQQIRLENEMRERQGKIAGIGAANQLGEDMMRHSATLANYGVSAAAGAAGQIPQARDYSALGNVAGQFMGNNMDKWMTNIGNWWNTSNTGSVAGGPVVPSTPPNYTGASVPQMPPELGPLLRAKGGYIPPNVRALVGESGTETIITDDGRAYEIEKETMISGSHPGIMVVPFSMKRMMEKKYANGGKGMGQGHHGSSGATKSLAARGI